MPWQRVSTLAAKACRSLGQTDEAIRWLQKALERERQYSRLKTNAWSEFVLLVADQRLEPHFEEALRVLAESEPWLIFPIKVFQWHAAYALIRAAQDDLRGAKEHAIKALETAEKSHSGLRYHSQLGLVGDAYEGIRDRLLQLAGRNC